MATLNPVKTTTPNTGKLTF